MEVSGEIRTPVASTRVKHPLPRYVPDRKQDGPQSQSENYGEKFAPGLSARNP